MEEGNKVFPKGSFIQQMHVVIPSHCFQKRKGIPKWIQIIKFSRSLWDSGESQVGVLIIDNMGRKKRDFCVWH